MQGLYMRSHGSLHSVCVLVWCVSYGRGGREGDVSNRGLQLVDGGFVLVCAVVGLHGFDLNVEFSWLILIFWVTGWIKGVLFGMWSESLRKMVHTHKKVWGYENSFLVYWARWLKRSDFVFYLAIFLTCILVHTEWWRSFVKENRRTKKIWWEGMTWQRFRKKCNKERYHTMFSSQKKAFRVYIE